MLEARLRWLSATPLGGPRRGPTPFHDEDYVRYVDGKPRYDGVESFLASRHISLPRGHSIGSSRRGRPSAPSETSKIAISSWQWPKTESVSSTSTIVFLRTVRSHGIRTALIPSSRHARTMLETARVTDLFDAIVDGIDAEALELPGKPDPADFATAAHQLNVAPARAAVVEDASGRRRGWPPRWLWLRHRHRYRLSCR